jgi:elongation factor Ts
MTITSETVKLLRDKTGAGMMDCKKALEVSEGDMDKAIEYLRKKGAATAEKRADRVANQGIIMTKISEGGKRGTAMEVNCETDFVARSENFVTFAVAITELIAEKVPASVDELLAMPYDASKTVTIALTELVGKVGEKLAIRRFEVVNAASGLVEAYTHMGSKIGVLVEIAAGAPAADLQILARDIAMQVAAMNPSVVSREEVKKDVIEHELEIYRQLAKNEGKPDQVIDRIANGKLEKYYQEVVLLEQSFIKDATKTIKDVVEEASKKLNDQITVRRFLRYQLGE